MMAKIKTVQVHGHVLDYPDYRINGRKFLPFVPCLCVQDTPDNPCPCSEQTYWIDKKDIATSRPADRVAKDGSELSVIELDSSSDIRRQELSVTNVHQMLMGSTPMPEGRDLQELFLHSTAPSNLELFRNRARAFACVSDRDFDLVDRAVNEKISELAERLNQGASLLEHLVTKISLTVKSDDGSESVFSEDFVPIHGKDGEPEGAIQKVVGMLIGHESHLTIKIPIPGTGMDVAISLPIPNGKGLLFGNPR